MLASLTNTVKENASAWASLWTSLSDGEIEIEDVVATEDVDESETEYLDGIVSGTDAGPFDVRDSDMTLTYDGTPDLEVGAYEFDLTVSGDAGLANRTIIGKVKVTVTASNEAPTAPGTFTSEY